MTFEAQRALGLRYEQAFMHWLAARGWYALPAYAAVEDDKAPRLLEAVRQASKAGQSDVVDAVIDALQTEAVVEDVLRLLEQKRGAEALGLLTRLARERGQ